MDEARRRELKKLGKAEVEARSATLEAAMQEARRGDDAALTGGRGWSSGYRTAYRNEAWLQRSAPILSASRIDKLFVVLPSHGAPRESGPYLVCRCGSAAPVSMPWKVFCWSSCACGNIRWRGVLGWRKRTIRDWELVFPAKLMARHRRAGSPGGRR